VFRLQVGSAAFQVQAEVAEQPLPVVGVDALEPLVGIVPDLGLLQRAERKIRFSRRSQSQSPSLLPSAASA